MALENSGASSPTAADILITFLREKQVVLAPADADAICATLDLTASQDLKTLAKPLRAALVQHGVQLRQTHALEVLAKMSGSSSWMRARQASEEKSCYLLLTVVEGETQAPQLLESIGEAVTALLTKALSLIQGRSETAFCTLNRNVHAFTLEVNQTHGPWFTLQMLKADSDALANNDFRVCPFDADALRTALRRVASNLEQARPALLVIGGAISETLAPTYAATWRVTGLRSSTQRVIIDERELFLVLDAAGCRTLRFDKNVAVLSGIEEELRVEQVWVDLAESIQPVNSQNPAEMEAVFKRYARFCAALPSSVAEMLRTVSGPERLGEWSARVDFPALEHLLEEQQLSVRDIAQRAGVQYRDVMGMRDYELASPELVARLAAILGTSPDQLQKKSDVIGFTVATGGQLLKMVAGAMTYRAVFGNSLTTADELVANQLLEAARDISEMKSFAPIAVGLDSTADALLKKAEKAGLKLLLAREIVFVRSDVATAEEGGYLGMRTLTVCIERASGGKPAMWAPVETPDK